MGKIGFRSLIIHGTKKMCLIPDFVRRVSIYGQQWELMVTCSNMPLLSLMVEVVPLLLCGLIRCYLYCTCPFQICLSFARDPSAGRVSTFQI